MNRAARKLQAEETLAILEGSVGGVDLGALEAAVSGSRLYLARQEPPSEIEPQDCTIEVCRATTLQALLSCTDENVAVLNFASAKNPGGGFLGGSLAQEESLAVASGLYPCLVQFDDFYGAHRADPRKGFYSHACIFSPQVPFFRDNDGALLDRVVTASVITCAAVNAGIVPPDQRDQVAPVMRTRVDQVLHVAAMHRSETLILGAWGCGVFKQDPLVVASLFSAGLCPGSLARRAFKRVIFAITDPRIVDIFTAAFEGGAVIPEPEATVDQADRPSGRREKSRRWTKSERRKEVRSRREAVEDQID